MNTFVARLNSCENHGKIVLHAYTWILKEGQRNDQLPWNSETAKSQTQQFAYCYFGSAAKIIQCDNLKTGRSTAVTEVKLNKAYSDLAEHYNTALLPCRVRSPKDKAFVEGTVGIISTFILAALRNCRFLSLAERSAFRTSLLVQS